MVARTDADAHGLIRIDVAEVQSCVVSCCGQLIPEQFFTGFGAELAKIAECPGF